MRASKRIHKFNYGVLALAGLGLITLGCASGAGNSGGGGGGGDSGAACVVGASAACTCSNGQSGAQTCGADNTFGQCACSSTGGVGPGAGGGGGASSCVQACDGRQCGPDPKCGLSCGTCGGSATCQVGMCVLPGGGSAVGSGTAVATFCHSLTAGDDAITLRVRIGGVALDAKTWSCSSCLAVPAGTDIDYEFVRVDTGDVFEEGSIDLEAGKSYFLEGDVVDGYPTFDGFTLKSEYTCSEVRTDWLDQQSGSGSGGGGGGGGSDQSCGTCMQNYCPSQYQACGQNNQCVALLECVGDCSSDGCVSSCVSSHPGGVDDLVDLIDCMDQSCGSCG